MSRKWTVAPLCVLSIVLGMAVLPPDAEGQMTCASLFTAKGPFEYSAEGRGKIAFLTSPLRSRKKMLVVSTTRFQTAGTSGWRPGQATEVTKITGSLTRSVQHIQYEYDGFFVEIVKPVLEHKVTRETKAFTDPEEASRHFREDLRGGIGKPSTETNLHAERFFLGRILEALDFVMLQYRDRKQWPASFLRGLVQTAFQYAFHSTYISIVEKTPDGRPGKILGSGRLISVPYLSLPALRANHNEPLFSGHWVIDMAFRNETSGLGRGLELTLSEAGQSFGLREPLNVELWREIFSKDHLSFDANDLGLPHPEVAGDLVYVPTPMENILNHYYPGHRSNPGMEIKNYVEPGNFAITPDRLLPAGLQGMIAKAIYFHAARLVRPQAGALGPATKVGTYASAGGSSDKFYRYLEFKLTDQISPVEEKGVTPTQEIWNVLTGDGGVLEQALQRRFGVSLENSEIDRLFEPFDRYEGRP